MNSLRSFTWRTAAILLGFLPVLSASPAGEREFIRLLNDRDSTEKERRSAFASIARETGGPSKKLKSEVLKVWEKAQVEVVRSAATKEVVREARTLRPLLTRTGERLRRQGKQGEAKNQQNGRRRGDSVPEFRLLQTSPPPNYALTISATASLI